MKIDIILVFTAGLVSFFSPCIVPLIPMYVSFLAGDLDEGISDKKKLYINAFGFFIGLMGVFILLGAVATTVGSFLLDISDIMRKVMGVIVMIFGIFQLGILKLSFLMKERKMRFKFKKAKFGTAILMGMAFSFGWTPCVGPVLGSVLIIAADSSTLNTGILYLVVYAFGFFIPFAAATLLMGYSLKWLDNIAKYTPIIKKITGVMLVGLGYMIYTNTLSRITLLFS